MSDSVLNVPGSVTVIFKRADDGVLGLDFFVVEVAGTGHAGTQPIHSSAVANFSGGADPDNRTELEALAQQIASDFYAWRRASLEVRYESIVPWTSDGLHDIEYLHERPPMATAVMRSTWEPEQGNFKHAGTFGSSDLPPGEGGGTVTIDTDPETGTATGPAFTFLPVLPLIIEAAPPGDVTFSLELPLAAGYGGTGLSDPGPAGYVLTSTGTAWVSATPPTGGAGTLSFAAGVAGVDFNVVLTTGLVTYNLPSASLTNRGAVTITAQQFAGEKTFFSITQFQRLGEVTHVIKIDGFFAVGTGGPFDSYLWFNTVYDVLFAGVAAWNILIIYNYGDMAKGSDGHVYRSVQIDNAGNDPTTSPTWWEAGPAQAQVTLVGGTAPCYAIVSPGSLHVGLWAITGGMEFCGGIYTGGKLLVDLETEVTGILPAINGGTGLDDSGTSGYVLTSDGLGGWISAAPPGGTGTVTSVSVVSANGVSGTVATPTTTPAITINLGVLTAGTWHATPIQTAFGGTGLTASGAAGNVLKSDGTNWISGAPGVTSVSVVTANGVSGTVANPTTTPAITLTIGTLPNLTVTGTITGSITGNAGTATKLATPVNINGVPFDGTASITVTAAAGTLTGTTLNASIINSSLTKVGVITVGTWNATIIGVGFGGTGLGVPGAAGNVLTSNGTVWISAPPAGGGAGNTFFVGTAGADFNVTVVAGAVTYNLPSASRANRGAVSKVTQTFGGQKWLPDGEIIWCGAERNGQLPIGGAQGDFQIISSNSAVDYDAHTITAIYGGSLSANVGQSTIGSSATAWNSTTTYSYGSVVVSGSNMYVYVSSTPSSGVDPAMVGNPPWATMADSDSQFALWDCLYLGYVGVGTSIPSFGMRRPIDPLDATDPSGATGPWFVLENWWSGEAPIREIKGIAFRLGSDGSWKKGLGGLVSGLKFYGGIYIGGDLLVDLENDVTGVLGAADGGTGLAGPGAAGNVLTSDGTGWVSSLPSGGGGGGTGTVTSVSVFTANGVSGTVATPTTTPVITLTLGAITPTSVAATGTVTGSNLSGTNTGDQSLAGLQPLDADLTAIAALTTTAFGRGSLTQVDAAAFRTYIGAGTGTGGGDVVGPGAATDNAITRFDGTTGKLIQNSVVTVGDLGDVAGVRSAIVGSIDVGHYGLFTRSTTAGVGLILGYDGTANATITFAPAVSCTLTLGGAAVSVSGVNTGDQTLAGLGGQPLDADLTAIAALATTSFGRGALEMADAAAFRTYIGAGAGSTGTVTSVSVTPANGVTGVVTNPTTTPAIALTLGDITPTKVSASGGVSGTVTDANTVNIMYALAAGHNTTATPAVGFGTGIYFALQDSTTPNVQAGNIQVQWVNATHGSQRSRLTFNAYDTGPHEGLRIEALPGLATGISFFGTTAAVAQQNGDVGAALVAYGLIGAMPTFAGANITGTVPNATTAAMVTTNANLTGPVTSVGNATAIGAGVVSEAMQILSNVPTGNVTTTRHGYVPIAPNDTTKFLRGDATWDLVTAAAGVLTGTTLAANVVNSSLTSVGTIASGVWNGTAIDAAHGGTGLTAPGTSGNVLTSSGSAWVSAAPTGGGGAPIDRSICNGRITTESGQPVSSADRTGQNSLYWTPFRGSQISLYAGSAWNTYTFAEFGAGLPAGLGNYDVFVWVDISNPAVPAFALETLAWTNDTTRATILVLQDGILVKSGAPTRRYVGTVRVNAANATEDSAAKRFVWNYYNQVPKSLYVGDTTDAWTYTSNAWRQVNANAANKVEIVVGQTSGVIFLQTATVSSVDGLCAIGVNNITTFPLGTISSGAGYSGSTYSQITSNYSEIPRVGYSYYTMMERRDSVASVTFLGDNANPAQWGNMTGMRGTLFG